MYLNTTQVLVAAALPLIGRLALVTRLGVSAWDLAAWERGEAEPDWPQFQALVELVIREQQAVIEGSGASFSRPGSEGSVSVFPTNRGRDGGTDVKPQK